jgi:hypothetical protein
VPVSRTIVRLLRRVWWRFCAAGACQPPFDINSIMTNHVAAVEFYAGPGTIPAELNATQGTCGALVIWTK